MQQEMQRVNTAVGKFETHIINSVLYEVTNKIYNTIFLKELDA